MHLENKEMKWKEERQRRRSRREIVDEVEKEKRLKGFDSLSQTQIF